MADEIPQILRISHTEPDTELLGPYRRFVIWVHGCCFDCPGCLAVNTRFGPYTETDTRELARQVLSAPAEGLTISGGEPFLQAAALRELIDRVRAERDLGVIVYSGFLLEELRERKDAAGLLAAADILIDGPYRRELDIGQAYVGSANQRIHYLTERYRVSGPAYYSAKKRRAEIKLYKEKTVLIGVPGRETLRLWQKMKESGRIEQ